MIKIDEDDPVGELEPSFPYRDVKIRRGADIKEFYDLQSEIGRGKFGTVYRCMEKTTGLHLAAKFVPTSRKEDKRNVEREIDIMRALQHPRLIQLYDAFDKDKTMVVVLELIEGGELFERVISDDFVLTEKSCTAFMRQICEGMEFIHQQNILHLDMKPENILCLTKTGNRIKIIDFGLARKFDPEKKLQVLFGTPEFVAPEVVNFDQIGYGTDMWSIGVICYVLLSGLSPFMGETDVETMANVTIAKWDFDDEAFTEISDDAKDFISNLLVKDKEKRLTATQCLLHPWLRRKPPVRVQTTTPSAVQLKPSPSELDLAKDNLKFFVDRWNEHPNSPYIFDTNCQTISPCVSFNNIPEQQQQPPQLQRSRTPSLSGCSPSPCGSISSFPDAEASESPPMPASPRLRRLTSDDDPGVGFGSPILSPKSHLYLDRFQMPNRRASDSSCFAKPVGDVVSRINLAEEIKRLSDRLLKLSQAQDGVQTSEESAFTYETGGGGGEDGTSNNSKFVYKAKIVNEYPGDKSGVSNSEFTSGETSVIYSTTSSTYETTDFSSDWMTPKRKFKFSNRDVPIHQQQQNLAPRSPDCENFSDTSSTLSSTGHSNPSTPEIFLDTPDLAKNLLHLLGKYDEFAPRTEVRRTSLSINWSEVETLSQRTMKSLSNFIQSPRNIEQRTKMTTTSTTATGSAGASASVGKSQPTPTPPPPPPAATSTQ